VAFGSFGDFWFQAFGLRPCFRRMAFGHILCYSVYRDYLNRDKSQDQKLFFFFLRGGSVLLREGVGWGVGIITTGIVLLDGVIDGVGVLLSCPVVLGVWLGVLLGVFERLCEGLGVGVMLWERLGVLVGLCELDGWGVLLGVTLLDGVVVGLGVNRCHVGLHTLPIFIAALYITPMLILILAYRF
jgi:hypothetical protein